MNRPVRSFRLALLAIATACIAAAPVHAADFVYRGSLSDRGQPAEGRYAFRLGFYDAPFGGAPVAPATTLDDVVVSGGSFSAPLALDPALQARERTWLQVEVRDATGGYVPLAERELLQPDALLAGLCWDTTGNTGNVANANFIGNIDNVPLDFRTNNQRGLRLQSSTTPNGVPSVVSGASDNAVLAAASGAVILGGGFTGGDANRVYDSDAAIIGGRHNSAGLSDGNPIGQNSAVVVGGLNNTASGAFSAVLGGDGNVAAGDASVAMGGGAQALHQGSFVWADYAGPGAFSTTAASQFMVRASGGVGINTAPQNATMTIANLPGVSPVLRIFNTSADTTLGGAVRITENGAAFSGGYVQYDAFANLLKIGVNNGSVDSSGDVDKIVMPRNGAGVGIGRTPNTNALEVEGNASKSTSGTWLSNSDARIKRDVAPIEHALDTLMRVRPVTFRYRDDYRAVHAGIDGRRYYNVIAQEFAEVFPDAVRSSGELLPGAKDASENRILQVDVHPALITTIAAAQELSVNADAQARQIARLQADNAQLRERLARIEQRLFLSTSDR